MSAPDNNTTAVRTQPLSARQERNLVQYIDAQLLDLTRNFKKRTLPSTTLPTLEAYLAAARPLLVLMLQVPPAPPQGALRSALLLRLTGELLGAVPGYPAAPPSLPALLELLDELDRGWCTVLRAQAWDPARHEGVDPGNPPCHAHTSADEDAEMGLTSGYADSPAVSQTDRTRLRSLLVSGTTRLEEWLEGLRTEDADASELDDLASALERLGLRQAFDGLFERTLGEMGELGGAVISGAGEVEMV
ncbi:hypothetical protein M0805_004625 [Coniferiporia weirii]|nr:hypothetical protein M0805_004625 [Coniferiporia weirii]